MKQFFGMSPAGNLLEAVRGMGKPQLIMLLSNHDQFEEHVKKLEELYPGVPSIGCIGMSYDTRIVEKGVGIIAFSDGVFAVANVLENVSTMPVKYIKRLEDDMGKVNGSQKDTVCIDFCSGNDACVLTTVFSVLKRRNISLVGGTGDAGKVSANGRVYEDAVAYALVKNLNGRVKAYKENIYHPMEEYRFIASKTDKAKYIIGELNGRPAKTVYQDILHITEKEILTQTFKNPFGKINGSDICIISIKDVTGNALTCFRQVNDSGAGRNQRYRATDHSDNPKGLSKNLSRIFRKLLIPLFAVYRKSLHAAISPGNGLFRQPRRFCRLWRTLQQPVCQPIHDLCCI